ncbi:MAG: SLATT domain-containing protein [Geminicoccaceae bacterium]
MAQSPHGGAYDGFPDGPESYREATADVTLRQLFQAAVRHAQDRIDWYDGKAGRLKGPAQWIRWLALVFFALGTLAPLVAGVLIKLASLFGGTGEDPAQWNSWDIAAQLPLAEIGYVLLGVAGASVIFDQFFDYSGSWIRFRQSQARLEVLLADLRFGWAELLAKCGGVIVDRPTAVGFVALLREFITKIEQLAEAETKEWAEQFRARVAAFDSNPNLKVRLPGGKADKAAAEDAAEGTAAADGGSTAAGTAPRTGPRPASVRVRVVIEGTDGIDAGSLLLLLDDVPLPVPKEFQLEVPLEVGVTRRFVATAKHAGQAVEGRQEITPTPDDEGRTLTLKLS